MGVVVISMLLQKPGLIFQQSVVHDHQAKLLRVQLAMTLFLNRGGKLVKFPFCVILC